MPPGHASDPDLAAEYRELTVSALRRARPTTWRWCARPCRRRAARSGWTTSRPRAWLRTTNDLRLALGTRLDITAETEPPDDPAATRASS